MSPDLRAEAHRLRLLSDVSRRLVHPVDLRSLHQQALRHAAGIAGASAGSLRIFDRQGHLVLAALHNAGVAYQERHLRLVPDAPEYGLALESSGPVCLGPEFAHPAVRELADDRDSGCILVRVAVRRTVVGLLTLVVSPPPTELSEPDFLFLQTLAELLAVGELNARSYSDLERTSRTDPLTGLTSRRHFEELFRRELNRARRYGRPLSLAMLDVDHLKRINDTWGHVTGDRVIATIGELLGQVRSTDVAARFGGDEFILLMPDTAQREAELVCDRLRERLKELNLQKSFPFPISLSVGVRELGPHDEDLLAQADAAMYHHKRTSRREAAEAPVPKRAEEVEESHEQVCPGRRDG